jgi:riboflavin kinase/FMN adenylyltransferase
MLHLRQLQPVNFQEIWATIGAFDGVHIGHQSIIRSLVSTAQEKQKTTAVITFHPHPAVVLRSIPMPFYLNTPEEKAEYFSQLGIDITLTLSFTPEMAALDPEAFFDMVCQHLPLRRLYLGADFALGKGRSGTIPVIREIGKLYGFEVKEAEFIMQNDNKVSSSQIRKWLSDGNLEATNTALGRYFSLAGTVIHGDARGRSIGFPTANIAVWEGKLLPSPGVYACWVKLNHQVHPAVTNIGYRPTFEDNRPAIRVETHLLHFDFDLYDQELELFFVYKLRPEIKFENFSALVQQIHLDVQKSEEILKNAAKPTSLSA